MYYKIHTCIYTIATYKITALWYVHICKYILSLSPAVLVPVEGRRLSEWKAVPAPQSLELGPRQRWGWLLRKEQKQQAQGLCPLETWWAVSGGSQQPCPIYPVAPTLPSV